MEVGENLNVDFTVGETGDAAGVGGKGEGVGDGDRVVGVGGTGEEVEGGVGGVRHGGEGACIWGRGRVMFCFCGGVERARK